MGMCRYLAMTAAEIAASSPLPEKLAYMACHFSSYGTGLSNCPDSLPEGSILILNDRIPIRGHDPQRIAGQLQQLTETLRCDSLLLDFQRPNVSETAALCRVLSSELRCPVGISELYADNLSGPVFLSAAPPDVPLQEHLKQWPGREIWLEATVETVCITVTEKGSEVVALPYCEPPETAYCQQQLHCRYQMETLDNAVRFQLWRTAGQTEALLQQAQELGIRRTIGLYQQFGRCDGWQTNKNALP